MGACHCLPYPRQLAAPPDLPQKRLSREGSSPSRLLAQILNIERQCRPELGDVVGPEDDNEDPELTVQVLLEEPDTRFCVCFSLESPVVIALLWARQRDVHIEDAWSALSETEERRVWDGTSEYWLLREAGKDDSTCEEVYHLCLHPPWPFWDRDILKRQWRLPLAGPRGQGYALVSQSFEDEKVLFERKDRVRAFVHKAGTLMRPLTEPNGSNGVLATGSREPSGIELTNCTQMDMGGLLPSWAQSVFAQFVVSKATAWAAALREHCHQKHDPPKPPVPDLSELSAQLPQTWAENWDMTESAQALDSESEDEHDMFIPSGSDAPTGWLV